MRKVFFIYYSILYPIFWLLYRIKPIHTERVAEGPALICANHSAYSDIIFLSFALGRKHYPRFVAKIELMRIPIFGRLIQKAGVIGIDRGKSDISAIRTILKALKDGDKVMLFPEGTRVQEEDANNAKNGAIMIASKSGVPIIPVYLPRVKKLFSRVPVVFGQPYTIEHIRGGSESYSAYADELMTKIEMLQNEI